MLKLWLRLAVVLVMLSGMVSAVGGKLPLNNHDCIRFIDLNTDWLMDVATGQVVPTTKPYEWSTTHPQNSSVITIINEDSGGIRSAEQLVLKNADREKVIDNQVWGATWSNRGEYIAYVRDDKTLVLANNEGEILKQVSMLDLIWEMPIFSADDSHVVARNYGAASHAYLYSIPDLIPVDHEGLENLTFYDWSPTGHLFTGMLDKQFVLVSPEKGIVSSRHDTEGSGLHAVWSPNGEYAVISGIQDLSSPGQVHEEYFLDLIDRTGFLKTDVVAPRIFVPLAAKDGREFFAWDEDNTLLAWRGTPKSGYELVRYDPLTEFTEVVVFLASRVVRPLEFLADGQWVLAWAEGYDLILIEVDARRQARLLNNVPKAPFEYMDNPRILWTPDEGLMVAAVEGQIGWVNLSTDVDDQAPIMFLSKIAGWLENRAIIYATLDEDRTWRVVKVDVSTNEQTILYEHLAAVDVHQVNPSTILVFWRKADNSVGIDVWDSSEEAAHQLLFPPSPTLNIDTISGNHSFLSPDKQQLIVNNSTVNNQSLYWFVLDGSQPAKLLQDDSWGLPVWKSDSSAFALMTAQQSLKFYDQMGESKRVIELPTLQNGRFVDFRWEQC